MERLLIIGGLFVLAGLCEIGGGYLVWGWMREHKPFIWALLGGSPRRLWGCGSATAHLNGGGGCLYSPSCREGLFSESQRLKLKDCSSCLYSPNCREEVIWKLGCRF